MTFRIPSRERYDSDDVKGQTITVRSGHREIALQFRYETRHSLIVTRLNMLVRNGRIACTERSGPRFELPNGRVFHVDEAEVDLCPVGVDFREEGFSIGGGGRMRLNLRS